MEIFGVGPLEFLLILVIALVILGPEDMVGTARKIGQWVYRLVHSDTWRAIVESTQDLRNLPQQIVRDAGLQEAVEEVKQTASEVKSQMTETTREIGSEMSAATRDMTSEMNAATASAAATAMMSNEQIRAAALQKAQAEAEAGTVSAPTILWPENNVAGADPSTVAAQTAEGLTEAVNPEASGGESPAVTVAETPPTESAPPNGDTPPDGNDGAAALLPATEAAAADSAGPVVGDLDTIYQELSQRSDHQSAEPVENAAPAALASSLPSNGNGAAAPQGGDEALAPQGGDEALAPQADVAAPVLTEGVEAPAPQGGDEAPVPAADVDTAPRFALPELRAPEGEEESPGVQETPVPAVDVESPPEQWAAGIAPFATGAAIPPGAATPLDDIEARLQARMNEMLEKLDKLEQASPAPVSPAADTQSDDFEARMQARMEEMLKKLDDLEQSGPAPAPPAADAEPPAENFNI